MNKNTPLNQSYICPIGADGTHLAGVTALIASKETVLTCPTIPQNLGAN